MDEAAQYWPKPVFLHRFSSMLSAEEIERYARHIVLREIGGQGQNKLKNARVLVIGAGGLGAHRRGTSGNLWEFGFRWLGLRFNFGFDLGLDLDLGRGRRTRRRQIDVG